MDLESLAPAEAKAWYLEDRQAELRTASLRRIDAHLDRFVEWLDREGITDLAEVSGRDLRRYKTWRKTEGNLATISLNGQLSTLATFLEFCATIEAVEPDLPAKVPVPNVDEDDAVSDMRLSADRAETILEYLDTFEYASRGYALFKLLWEVGLRLGAARGIDLSDFEPAEKQIRLRHWPGEGPDDYGTPLKNGRTGERNVNISGELATVIEDYVGHHRKDVIDDVGRQPLFTTKRGRMATATIRRSLYKLTRPCEQGVDCPDDREPKACEAAQNRHASKCPFSRSSHPIRRGSIMHQLDQGVPKEILSDRVDVSKPVLDKHYDRRSEERKRKQRRSELAKRLDGYETDA